MNSAVEITNLLYQYAEYIDAGRIDLAMSLFQHAKLKLITSEALQDSKAALSLLEKVIVLYSDGTPKTKHVVTNPIINIDEAQGKASCRSQYTVFQALDDFGLQPVAAGRYDDRFEIIGGKWQFVYRDLTLFDMKGDLSHHLNLSAIS